MDRRSSFLAGMLLAALAACGGGGGGSSSGGGSTPPPVSVSIAPPSATVTVLKQQQFHATVSNSSNPAASFAVQEGAAGGSVDGSGLYTAPSAAGTYHVVATSQADASAKASATVSVVAAPSVSSFTAAKATITTGTATTLTAVFSGGSGVVDQGRGAVSSGVAISTGTLSSTTTFTLTVTNAAGDTATAAATVTVVPAPAITSFAAAQAFVASGSATTLTAVFSGGSGSVDHGVGGVSSGVAASTGTLNADTTFTLTVTNAAGDTATSQASVGAVTAPPSISSFTATPATITLGHSSTLAWTVTGQHVASLSIDNGVGSVAATGSTAVSPSTATTYTLTATNAKGTVTAQATVSVVFAPQISSFTASPSTLLPGGASTLTPVFTQGTGSIDQGIGAVVSGTGYATGTLGAAKTYTLTVTNLAGDSATQALTVNVDPGSFSAAGNAMAVGRVGHTATLMANGKVLLTGGVQLPGYTPTADEFDPAANAGAGGFSATANDMAVARSYHAAVLLPNGKVLVAGGLGNGSSTPRQLSSADLYDPATRAFSPSSHAMAEPRQQASATLLPNGKVLIAGGYMDTGNTLGSAELYDPVTDTFSSSAGSMGNPRWGHVGILLPNGKVLIAGGNTGVSSAPLELYDPQTDSFVPTGDSSTVGSWGGVNLLQNGKVLLSMDNTDGRSSVIYDPATGLGTATASLGLARSNIPNATLMGDGHVLVSGNTGNPGMDVPADCEYYDPAGGLFHFSADPGDRWEHTGSLVPDGRVLLAGGYDSGSHQVLASGVLFSAGPAVAAPIPAAGVSAPASVAHGSTGLIASVPITAGATYAWTISGGTITAGAGTRAITFSAGAAGTLVLDCLVTSSAGVPGQGSSSVTVN